MQEHLLLSRRAGRDVDGVMRRRPKLWFPRPRGISIKESSCHRTPEYGTIASVLSRAKAGAATTVAYACGSCRRTSCRQVAAMGRRWPNCDALLSTWSPSAAAAPTLRRTPSQHARAAITPATGCPTRPSRRRIADLWPARSSTWAGISDGSSRRGYRSTSYTAAGPTSTTRIAGAARYGPKGAADAVGPSRRRRSRAAGRAVKIATTKTAPTRTG